MIKQPLGESYRSLVWIWVQAPRQASGRWSSGQRGQSQMTGEPDEDQLGGESGKITFIEQCSGLVFRLLFVQSA